MEGLETRGRPNTTICINGHDKTAPRGTYWVIREKNGKTYQERRCAACERNWQRKDNKTARSYSDMEVGK